jgi:hypothetical protein
LRVQDTGTGIAPRQARLHLRAVCAGRRIARPRERRARLGALRS